MAIPSIVYVLFIALAVYLASIIIIRRGGSGWWFLAPLLIGLTGTLLVLLFVRWQLKRNVDPTIEILPGEPHRPSRELGWLGVTGAPGFWRSLLPCDEDGATSSLRAKAATMGADAVVRVEYVSVGDLRLGRVQSLKATGVAIQYTDWSQSETADIAANSEVDTAQ